MVQRGKNAETKHVICTVCDNYCPLKANVVGGVLQGLEPYEDPKAICFKAHSWKEHINHPDRILHPMKNVGTRGRSGGCLFPGIRRWTRLLRGCGRSSEHTAQRALLFHH